jgi:transposase InsO family protein
VSLSAIRDGAWLSHLRLGGAAAGEKGAASRASKRQRLGRPGRDFSALAPDRLWVADFTYLRCCEGPVFFAFVIDVFSRRIVGWQLAGHMRTDLVLDALRRRSRAVALAPMCSWCTLPMPAANTSVTRPGRSSTTTACSARSAMPPYCRRDVPVGRGW